MPLREIKAPRHYVLYREDKGSEGDKVDTRIAIVPDVTPQMRVNRCRVALERANVHLLEAQAGSTQRHFGLRGARHEIGKAREELRQL